jgi:hypothetical protein
MTNLPSEGAEKGAEIFLAYAQRRHAACYDKIEFVLAALLTDLMHFAAAQGADFDGCVEWARLRHDDQTGIWPDSS